MFSLLPASFFHLLSSVFRFFRFFRFVSKGKIKCFLSPPSLSFLNLSLNSKRVWLSFAKLSFFHVLRSLFFFSFLVSFLSFSPPKKNTVSTHRERQTTVRFPSFLSLCGSPRCVFWSVLCCLSITSFLLQKRTTRVFQSFPETQIKRTFGSPTPSYAPQSSHKCPVLFGNRFVTQRFLLNEPQDL